MISAIVIYFICFDIVFILIGLWFFIPHLISQYRSWHDPFHPTIYHDHYIPDLPRGWTMTMEANRQRHLEPPSYLFIDPSSYQHFDVPIPACRSSSVIPRTLLAEEESAGSTAQDDVENTGEGEMTDDEEGTVVAVEDEC